ncbi:maleylacetoacetate isomerase [Burkholderia cepacia]|uniref:maleylacetoacetate isomerase n=1 Tax=Burkholderia cepacia TaxID=292 RepID=UPI002AB73609|nr:maleylacetoacetate isomerase [Burkholderia cepacia]
MRLFYNRNSSASRRIQIALELKKIEYESIEIDLSKGEHLTDRYRSVHPQCLVPALEVGNGIVLTQSEAIVTWLDNRYSDPPLLGSDPKIRPSVMEVVNIIGCDVHPLQGLRLSRWLEDEDVPPHVFKAIAQRAVSEGLHACEQLLQRAAHGRYSFSDHPGAADIWLAPQVVNARRHGIDTRQYRRIHEIEGACLQLDAFRRILLPVA